MHGHTNWMYVIDVVPRTHRVLQNMEELSSIDEINRILHDTNESLEEEGSSTQEEISYYNSTSTGGSSSSDFGSESVFLETGESDTILSPHANVVVDTISHNTTRLHLEVVLEIDHDDLYADVTSSIQHIL